MNSNYAEYPIKPNSKTAMAEQIKPILSVLVTFYRHLPYVDDCLQSLLKQKTQYPFEILIAVDGEDDGTMDLLEKYSKHYPNVRYWKVWSDLRKPSICRSSNNLIFLLKKAVGKYLIVLDGDDFFCSDRRFEEGIDFLEKHEDYIAHCCGWCKYHHDTGSFTTMPHTLPQSIMQKEYLEKGLYVHIAMNIFRNIFLNGEEYPEPDFFNDTTLTAYIMSKEKFYFSGKEMVAYRVGIESAYTSQSRCVQCVLPLLTNIVNKKLIGYDNIYNRFIDQYCDYIIKHPEELSEELKKQVLYMNLPLPFDITKLGKKETIDSSKRKKSVRELLAIPHNRTEKIRLSVLITFCNQVQYVEECLNSVLMQQCDFSFEVLIAVDGEDDGTISLLKKYSGKYPFIKYWKVNSDKRLLALSRASMNRLFLLEKSCGEYFCVLDGDDFFIDSRHFADAVFFLDRNDDFIGYSYNRLVYNHIVQSFISRDPRACIITLKKGSASLQYMHLSSFIYRNIYCTNHINFPGNQYFDDCIASRFMLTQGNFYLTDTYSYGYRMNCGSEYQGKTSNIQYVLSIAVWIKVYHITKNKGYLHEIIRYIKRILDDGTFVFAEDVRQQILYQNIPIARDFVRFVEFSDEEKEKFLKRIRNFISKWQR